MKTGRSSYSRRPSSAEPKDGSWSTSTGFARSNNSKRKAYGRNPTKRTSTPPLGFTFQSCPTKKRTNSFQIYGSDTNGAKDEENHTSNDLNDDSPYAPSLRMKRVNSPDSAHRRAFSDVERCDNIRRQQFARQSRKFASLSSLDDRSICGSAFESFSENNNNAENIHPNLLADIDQEENQSPYPPSKVKKIQQTPINRFQRQSSMNADMRSSPSSERMHSIHKRSMSLHSAFAGTNVTGRQSPAFSSASSASSFSSLAKSGSTASCWIKALEDASDEISKTKHKHSSNGLMLSKSERPVNRLKRHATYCSSEEAHSNTLSCSSTPERSLMRRNSSLGSSLCSRKRGVCDSPPTDIDSMILRSPDDCQFSRCKSLTSCYTRTRSRSRLFSKKLSSDTISSNTIHSKIVGTDNNTNSNMDIERPRRVENKISDEEDEEDEISNSKIISPTASLDSSTEDSREESSDILDTLIVAEPPHSLKRCTSLETQDSLFGTNVKDGIDVSMIPSVSDLQYIVKMLSKFQNSQKVAAFGSNNQWTVIAPPGWSSSRKAVFFQWATKCLGFSLRPAGGGVSYLQTSSTKGTLVLTNLKEALLKMNKNSSEANRGPCVISNAEGSPKVESNTNGLIPPFFHRTSLKSARKQRLNVKVSPLDRNIEVQLLSNLDQLTLSSKIPSTTDCDDHEYITTSVREVQNNSPAFVRTVTIESNCNTEQPPPETTHFTESPKEVQRKARLSAEHVAGGRDVLMHCHGISPTYSSAERPTPSGIITSWNTGLTSDYISPQTTSSHMSCTRTAQHLFSTGMETVNTDEHVETPMPTGCASIWGSRPIVGKDWGSSEISDPIAIAKLTKHLDEVLSHANVRSTESSLLQSCPPCPSQICLAQGECLLPSYDECGYVNPIFSALAVTSTELGFDHEADSTCDQNFLPQGVNSTKNTGQNKNEIESDEKLSALENFCLENSNVSFKMCEETRRKSFAKHARVSLCSSHVDTTFDSHATRSTNIKRPNAFRSKEPDVCDNIQKSGGAPLTPKLTLDFMCSPCFSRNCLDSPPARPMRPSKSMIDASVVHNVTSNHQILHIVFSFLGEGDLLCRVYPVCSHWAEVAAQTHASLAARSLNVEENDYLCEDFDKITTEGCVSNSPRCMERSWSYLKNMFPYGNFLSEGTFKQVYRVWNENVQGEEAISVMDVNFIESTGNINIVRSELSTSILLSSLVRRNICPNFVVTRSVFTCPFRPPTNLWGCAEKRIPKRTRQTKPKDTGLYQYMRMELCEFGDLEDYIGRQSGKVLNPFEARMLFFQMAFALHTASDKFGLKHYDVKLLNFFMNSLDKNKEDHHSHVALRYGFGAHVFYLRMKKARAFVVKLADFGTSNMQPESDGQPVTLAQFTTLENSPPEFLLHGDAAKQGYGHDCFALGLCMLHLFTGHGPYEEIMSKVVCPPSLRKKLKSIWENGDSNGYDVIKSVILSDVYENDDGNLEGLPDETFYDTLYRFVVLFGLPEDDKQKQKKLGPVWRALFKYLQCARGRKSSSDSTTYKKDCKKFSFLYGNDTRIASARRRLENMEGGIDLLLSLVSFDQDKRASPLDVINSMFMKPLRETSDDVYGRENDHVYSFMSYSTK